jgi:hypothetical protein
VAERVFTIIVKKMTWVLDHVMDWDQSQVLAPSLIAKATPITIAHKTTKGSHVFRKRPVLKQVRCVLMRSISSSKRLPDIVGMKAHENDK